MKDCVRFHVSGRVQGVWYRAATREQAERLGLTGHAINLSDGRVEILACGPPDAIDALQAWLWKGPPRARVESVERVADPRPDPSGFPIGFMIG